MTAPLRERNRAIVDRRREGWGLGAIAMEFRLSRQRVWQILREDKIKAHGRPSDPQTFHHAERFGP